MVMKRCPKCGSTKSTGNFHKDSTRKDGLAVWCKPCVRVHLHKHYQKNKERLRAAAKAYRERLGKDKAGELNRIYGRRWRLKNPDYNRITTLARYGLTPETYTLLLQSQGGGCAICGSTEKRLHIDHNHVSGKRRGLLCQHCNHGLGNFMESPKLMRAAMRYLAGWLKRTNTSST